jgi:serine/threonine protein kinase
LTDFGLARAADDATLSRSGVIAGTPQYMAPEQARGEELDPRADLFSLGSVLYTLCTGHPPFRAGNAMAILKKVCDETPSPVRELNPAVPEWLCAVIDRLHAKERDDRFASAAEVADLLSRHAAHLREPTRTPPPPKVEAKPATKASPKGWPRWVLVGAGIGLTFGFVTLAVMIGLQAFRSYYAPGEIHLSVKDRGLLILVDGPGDMQRWETSHADVLPKAQPGPYTLRVILNNQVIHTQQFTLAPREHKEINLPQFIYPDWSPGQVHGRPNVPTPGEDSGKAWASLTQDEQDEWLILTYARPVAARALEVYETHCPGALTRVTALGDDGTEVELWADVDPTPRARASGVSKLSLRPAPFPVRRVKLYLDSMNVRGWNEIDAVALIDETGDVQWVEQAEASSTYVGR